MMDTQATYDSILRENEDLLLRNSELELENSILREGASLSRQGPVPPNQPSPMPKPPNPPNPPKPEPPKPPKPEPPKPEPPKPEPPDEEPDHVPVKAIDVEVDFQSKTGAKVVRIKTDLGKTMYTVTFIAQEGGNFLVKVWRFGNLAIPVEIIRNQYGADQKDVAVRQFRTFIRDYMNLVKAETSELDPRKIFDECVDYRIIDPDCCRNCQFSAKEDGRKGKGFKPEGRKTLCTNAKNVAQYRKILRDFNKTFFSANQVSGDGQPPDVGFIGCDGHEKFMFSPLPDSTYPFPQPFPPYVPPIEIDMRVPVDPKGLCLNYTRKDSPKGGGFDNGGSSIEFDRDLLNLIDSIVDDKIGRISQEDVIVYCGGAEEERRGV